MSTEQLVMSDNDESIASSVADTQSDVTSVALNNIRIQLKFQEHMPATSAKSDVSATSLSQATANPPEVQSKSTRAPDFEDAIKGKLLARHGIFGAHEIYEDMLFNKPVKGERVSSKRLQNLDANAPRDFSDLGSIDKHYIIRFPNDVAETIRSRSEAGEDMGVVIEPTGRYDYREFMVKVRGVPLELIGILVELPCHVEAHKTLDCDLLFKSADISQIMIVQERKQAEITIEEMRQRLWEWPDGITPPTKNIRKRRFRNLDVYNNEEIKEAEREVLTLLNGLVRDSYHFEIKSAQEVKELLENFRKGLIEERIIGPDEDVETYINALQQYEGMNEDSEIMFNGKGTQMRF
uniref:TAFII55 protein conserved region containing protein n=1 Tax=Babesia bovis TaxID=5865 RepID=S6B8X2_BABBO|nr:TAFII55 protein conserved region containing protein [Babesia bovis]